LDAKDKVELGRGGGDWLIDWAFLQVTIGGTDTRPPTFAEWDNDSLKTELDVCIVSLRVWLDYNIMSVLSTYFPPLALCSGMAAYYHFVKEMEEAVLHAFLTLAL
jgi:hypothetical protein